MRSLNLCRSKLPALVAILASSLSPSLSLGEFESLETIAEIDPSRDVLLHVSFHRIQRIPAIVDLLRGSSLALEWVKSKNVGSGGAEGGDGGGDA